MNGFIAIFTTGKNIRVNIPNFWKRLYNFQISFFHRQHMGDNFQIEQFSPKKIENEKLWIETDDFKCINEGIIHNIKDLCKYHNVKDSKSLNIYLCSFYRYARALMKHLPKSKMWKNTLGLEQFWYVLNLNTKNTLNKNFTDYIHLIEPYYENHSDVLMLYRQGNITEKTQELTLLVAIKLHFE